MSTPSAAREAILDEDEDDWVQMKIIEGWSHGYLQMLSLLPEAVQAIDMLADWVTGAFEKHDKLHPVLSTPPATSAPPRIIKSTQLVEEEALAIGGSDDNDDAEVLSFTPKKRAVSRCSSPSPALLFKAAPRAPASLYSSDEATSSAPHTPESEIRHSPPFPSLKGDPHLPLPTPDHLHALSSRANSPMPTLISPAHHALREELSQSLFLPHASGRSVSAPSSSPNRNGVTAEDASAPNGKSTRSNSLEASNAKFMDAKEMLRRRRADVVYGISGANSAAVSDED